MGSRDEPIISNRDPRPGWPESRAVIGPTGGPGLQGFSGYSGFAGVPSSSGYSGLSGYSGFSGYSGGPSGYSGYSGYSGTSGGPSGFSGYSGSGISGYSGPGGASGFSGYSGYSSTSGYSGYSSSSGYSGYSSLSGYSGYSGSGISGYSGYSGPMRTSNTASYKWNTSISNADPGSGKIAANNATLTSATLLHINVTDQNSNSLTALLTSFNQVPYAVITIFDQLSPLNFAIFDVLAFTNNTTYWDLTVANLFASGTLTNNLAVRVQFQPRSNNAKNSQALPGDPAGTTNTTGVMMGLAGAITPFVSGNVLLMISGTIANGTSGDGAKATLYYGTGTAPVNGAALVGTPVSGAVKLIAAASPQKAPFAVQAIVTGLTAGIAIWIDIALAAITAGTANIYDISVSAIELP